ncbi:DUF6946 family protein, partial [Cupriavidus sp. CP313]
LLRFSHKHSRMPTRYCKWGTVSGDSGGRSTGHALMLVHSFSQTHEWFEDYQAFAALFGINAELNRVHMAKRVGGVTLHLGWVCGAAEYLTR